jgi:hypothetical protein
MQSPKIYDDILPEFWGTFKKQKTEAQPAQKPRERTRTFSGFFNTVDPNQLEIYRAIDMAG